LLPRSIRQILDAEFRGNGNPRHLLSIDPARTLGKNEGCEETGSECVVGKPEVNRVAPGFRVPCEF
jgi:hypothetical protein